MLEKQKHNAPSEIRSIKSNSDWIEPAQDSDRLWALVTVVMNLRVP